MYCSSLIMRMPGNYHTFLHDIRLVLECYLEVVHAAPPDGAREWAKQFVIYNGWDPDDKDIVELIDILNGWWSEDWWVVHYCRCNVKCTKKTLIGRLHALLIRTLFSGRPGTPIPARWMKVLKFVLAMFF